MQRTYQTFTIWMVISLILSSSFIFAPKPNTNHHLSKKSQPDTTKQHQTQPIHKILRKKQLIFYKKTIRDLQKAEDTFEQESKQYRMIFGVVAATSIGIHIWATQTFDLYHYLVFCSSNALGNISAQYLNYQEYTKMRNSMAEGIANSLSTHEISQLQQRQKEFSTTAQQLIDQAAQIQSRKSSKKS